MKLSIIVLVLVILLSAFVVAEAELRSPVCKSHVACIRQVLRSSHICVGEMLCKQLCEDVDLVIASALDTPFLWEKHCGTFADSARYALRYGSAQLVNTIAGSSGCGEQACSSRLRMGNVASLCSDSNAFDQVISDAICYHAEVVVLEDDEFNDRHVRAIAAPPEGSVKTVSPTAPTTTVITAGTKAGDIIGFIVLCALIIACVIPMTILFFRWLFLTIKNFDSQAFLGRFQR